ncbi:MAG TPA: translation initiation factor IF-3 [Thermoanaerobaculia bacterium]|nr:translation initiation factor IF-3 [Thermoanaerobaculia bacterium]
MEHIIDKTTRVNDRIRVREVRLIDADGSQAGIVPVEEALRRAQEQALDLVEVAPTAKPPVCRVMDFGKFLYQQKKKAHESKKKQKIIQVKEVKFRPNIDDHDYDFKLKNVVRFLEEGDKVKATVQFRGREMARTDLGHKLLARVAADVGERGVVESHPEMAGNRMHVILGPPRHGVKKATS